MTFEVISQFPQGPSRAGDLGQCPVEIGHRGRIRIDHLLKLGDGGLAFLEGGIQADQRLIGRRGQALGAVIEVLGQIGKTLGRLVDALGQGIDLSANLDKDL